MQRRQWLQRSLWTALWLAGCGDGDEAEPDPPRFRPIDLGTIDGHAVQVMAINEGGDSTGMATAADGRRFAFAHVAGRLVDLGALFPGALTPLAINAAGWVVGRSLPDDLSDVVGMEPERPFVFDGRTVRQLHDELGEGGEAWDINDGGVLTGRTQVLLDTEDSRAEAFRYDGTTARWLGHLGGLYTEGRAINAAGWVTGFSQVARDLGQSPAPPYHAFVHDGTTMRDLGTLGGQGSQGLAINGDGWVTGSAAGADGLQHAFVHEGAAMRDLGLLDGRMSMGTAINDAGRVVGMAGSAGSAEQVAVIAHLNGLHDLNRLLDEPSEWRLIEALAILADGRVLVRGRRGDDLRSFLLLPSA